MERLCCFAAECPGSARRGVVDLLVHGDHHGARPVVDHLVCRCDRKLAVPVVGSRPSARPGVVPVLAEPDEVVLSGRQRGERRDAFGVARVHLPVIPLNTGNGEQVSQGGIHTYATGCLARHDRSELVGSYAQRRHHLHRVCRRVGNDALPVLLIYHAGIEVGGAQVKPIQGLVGLRSRSKARGLGSAIKGPLGDALHHHPAGIGRSYDHEPLHAVRLLRDAEKGPAKGMVTDIEHLRVVGHARGAVWLSTRVHLGVDQVIEPKAVVQDVGRAERLEVVRLHVVASVKGNSGEHAVVVEPVWRELLRWRKAGGHGGLLLRQGGSDLADTLAHHIEHLSGLCATGGRGMVERLEGGRHHVIHVRGIARLVAVVQAVGGFLVPAVGPLDAFLHHVHVALTADNVHVHYADTVALASDEPAVVAVVHHVGVSGPAQVLGDGNDAVAGVADELRPDVPRAQHHPTVCYPVVDVANAVRLLDVVHLDRILLDRDLLDDGPVVGDIDQSVLTRSNRAAVHDVDHRCRVQSGVGRVVRAHHLYALKVGPVVGPEAQAHTEARGQAQVWNVGAGCAPVRVDRRLLGLLSSCDRHWDLHGAKLRAVGRAVAAVVHEADVVVALPRHYAGALADVRQAQEDRPVDGPCRVHLVGCDVQACEIGLLARLVGADDVGDVPMQRDRSRPGIEHHPSGTLPRLVEL